MKKKILIVEDEPEMRTILALELETSGYEVFQAEDGDAGFHLAAEVKPDLVISDVMMPKADGNQFFKKLRQSDFGRKVPFIVLTARRKMRDYFELFGDVEFIEKPFNAEDLLAKIRTILDPSGSPEPERLKTEGKPLVMPEIPRETVSIVEEQMVEQARPSVGDIPPGPDEAKAGAPPVSRKKRWKVLLLENDPHICGRIKDCFEQAGAEVQVVYSVARCVESAVLYAPDVVISKSALAESKVEALVKILRELSHFQNKPILVYSYTHSEDLKTKVLSAGANHFLVNPTEVELLRLSRQLIKN